MDLHRVVQQGGKTLDDGEAKPKALGAVPFEVVDLIELLKDVNHTGVGNPDTLIPNLNPQELTTGSTAKEDFSTLGIADGIGDQISDHAFQQRRMALGINRVGDRLRPLCLFSGDLPGDRHAEAGHAVDHLAGDPGLDLLRGQSPGPEAPADQNLVPMESRFHESPLAIASCGLTAHPAFLPSNSMCRSR